MKVMTSAKLKSLLKDGKPGRYTIGNGLYFRISKEKTGFWVVRYSINKKRREITIGKYPDHSLAQANAEAAQIKLNVSENIDPLVERNLEQIQLHGLMLRIRFNLPHLLVLIQ